MSDAAAFSATYSDWRLIKGRKVIQVVLELPLEDHDIAYKVLGGMPNPAAEVWVGVAPLDPKVRFLSGEIGEAPPRIKPGGSTQQRDNVEDAAAGEAHLPKQPPSRSLSQDVYLHYLNKPTFRVFLEQRRRHAIPKDNHINNADEAKHVLRSWLGIESLSELDRDPAAADRWEKVEADYKGWLNETRYVEAP